MAKRKVPKLKKRQIMHVTVGSPDWDPTKKELKNIAELFMSASLDPLGCVVTTRPGVTIKLIDADSVVSVTVEKRKK